MYSAYDNGAKLVNQLHKERQAQLARAYADGQADLITLKAWTGKLATIVGSALLRSGQSLRADAHARQQQHQPIRARASFDY
jgi:hypothetical protein